jgi:hypothetical protein
MSGDQYVSGVVAIRIGHNRYRGMDDRWQVLRGVDRGIDLAVQNRGFNRIGEDTPAANLGQGGGLVDVAFGRDDTDFDRSPGVSGAEAVSSKIGLGQCERAAPSAKPDRPVGKWGNECHAGNAVVGDEVRVAKSKFEIRETSRSGEVADIENLRKSC